MDFELPEGEDSCWVMAGPWSVYIRKTDDGLVVEVYPCGREMDEAVAGCVASDDDLPKEV